MFGKSDDSWQNSDSSDEARESRASATGQLHALIEQLQHICRVVHPKNSNLTTYGHEIRNVLILACTEVEDQCKAILKVNAEKEGRSTEDYVKLATPMRLSEYAVALPYYPWIRPIRPFEHWHSGSKSPTKDLPWYDAYNTVKHNREDNFHKATLQHAFEALTGFFVILCAQYGSEFAASGDAAARAFFQLMAPPRWPLSEFYVPGYSGTSKPRGFFWS
jgi:hypothetical protein